MSGVRDTVLYHLEQNRSRVVSGQVLADACGVSRTAVWKAIQTLKQEGHTIETAQSAGYRLVSDVLTEAGLRAQLDKAGVSGPLVLLDETPSTNGEALRLLGGGTPPGTLVVAKGQTAGRGRSGKSFFSPPDAGLYMSLVLPLPAGDPTLVTIAAAVAVRRALLPWTGEDRLPEIKWVNDIYLGGKKAVGILTEGFVDVEQMTLQSVVIGIGVNIYPPTAPCPDELKPRITCLFPNGDAPPAFSRCRLAADICRECTDVCSRPGDPSVLAEYRQHSFLLGKAVTFQWNGQARTGVALDVNEQGNLLVQSDGETLALQAGEVSVRPGKAPSA